MANRTDEVRERIEALLRERHVTENKMAGDDSALQVRLNQQISHGKKMSAETLLVVLDYFPDVSAEWLLRGIEHPADSGDAAGAEYDKEDAIRVLAGQLAEKDRQIARLTELLLKGSAG